MLSCQGLEVHGGGWAGLPGDWGAPGLSPLCSVPCQQLYSVLQAGMKGLLSSCSPSSTAVASPSQQTNSQCWAQGQGGGSPPQPNQPQPWQSPGLLLAQHSYSQAWGCHSGCVGVLPGQMEFGVNEPSTHFPRVCRQPLAWPGPHLRVALSSNILFPRHKVIFWVVNTIATVPV